MKAHTERGDKGKGAPLAKRRSFYLRLLVLLFIVYAIGFGAFVVGLPKPLASDDASAEAIVALTGEGGRLAPAVALLEMGNGQRLLISGVNKRTSKAELRSLLKGGMQFDCCADLGFAAEDTRGNAEEAAKWARAHNYRSLIIVTAAYHMPRSLLEFGAAMPDVELSPYPVAADLPAAPSWQALRRLNGEYVKYLASWTRISALRLAHRI